MSGPFNAPPPSALIFDCDGTLADTMGAHFTAWSAALARYGLGWDKVRFLAMAGMPARRIVQTLSAEEGRAVDIDALCAERERDFLTALPHIGPVAPVVEIALTHRGRLPMAVASGSIRPTVHAILDQLGIRHWFDMILTAEDTARHKPDPDVFLLAAERLGVPAGQCTVYEDSIHGLEAARRAGMRGVDVRTWYRPRAL